MHHGQEQQWKAPSRLTWLPGTPPLGERPSAPQDRCVVLRLPASSPLEWGDAAHRGNPCGAALLRGPC
jgi:hypothetical protein